MKPSSMPLSRPCRPLSRIWSPYRVASVSVRCSTVPSVPPRPVDVVVVGSGIGGLTTGRALLDAGMGVKIYERRSEKDALSGPAGLNLQYNAVSCLSQMSGTDSGEGGALSDKVVERGSPIRAGGFRDERGSQLMWFDVASLNLDSKGITSNGVCITRDALQACLHSSLPKGTVTFERGFKSFSQDPISGRITVTFEDGSSDECDILVGADGIRSPVRAQLYGGGPGSVASSEPSPPEYSGAVCWRAVVPYSKLPGGKAWFKNVVENDTWSEMWGQGVRWGWFDAGSVTEGSEELIMFHTFANKPPSWQAGTPEEELKELRRLLAGFSSPLPEILDALNLDSLHASKLYDRPPLPQPVWGSGGVTLVGDAAHAVLPSLGQGACFAIEDSFELANALGTLMASQTSEGSKPSGSQIASCLRSFEATRHPRVVQLWTQSREVHQLAMEESPVKCFIRNMIYRLTPKWAADAQFTWLTEFKPTWGPGARVGSN